jgi:glycosyltransferase involved in cell wall biosynthesis
VSRLRWKERVEESWLLQRGFAWSSSLVARWRLLRGNRFGALQRLFHAWKHLGDAGIGARRVAWIERLVADATREPDGSLAPIARNALRAEFVASSGAAALRAKFAAFPPADRVRLRYPRPMEDAERQGDVMVLKSPDDATREKGALLVMYHEAIEAFAACFDLAALAARWQLVLETSTWGTREWRLLPYLGSDLDVLVMAPREDDFALLDAWKTNLVPVRVGSADWVDPSVFAPKLKREPYLYDVAMVASWDPLKRHEVLLAAAAAAKAKGRTLSLLLIGVPGVWNRTTIESMIAAHDLTSSVTVMEKISHAEVARFTARSRCTVVLSRREGSSRVLGESLLCGTPVVVFAGQIGIDRRHVNPRTGVFAEDDALADALITVCDAPDRFDPRGYADEALGFANATRTVNDALKALAARRGTPWTRDIVAKKNAPNLRYAEPGTGTRFERDYESLATALLPASTT